MDGVAMDEVSKDAKVFILEPQDGAVVAATFTVKFGASGVDIVPAGTMEKNSGHHHLLIDVDTLPDMHMPLPATDHIIPFGKGQTETQVTLSPGNHSLQLVLGNFSHIPHKTPLMSKKITVTVK
jgi:hypothetical protein